MMMVVCEGGVVKGFFELHLTLPHPVTLLKRVFRHVV